MALLAWWYNSSDPWIGLDWACAVDEVDGLPARPVYVAAVDLACKSNYLA
jgi:hypothetical protein